MVEVNIPEVSAIFEWGVLFEASEVLPEVISLEEDRRVVVEKEVEERDVPGVSIALKSREWFVADFEHDVSVVFEQDLWRGKFASCFDLAQHIVHLYVDIVQHPLGLETQGQQSVGFCLGQLIFLDVLGGVGVLQVLHFLLTQQVLGGYLEQVDVWSYRVLSQLLQNMWIFSGGVCEHMRPALQDSVEKGLKRLHKDLVGVFLHDVVLFFGVFSHLYVLFLL